MRLHPHPVRDVMRAVVCSVLLAMTSAVAARAELRLAPDDCGGWASATWTCTNNSGNAITLVASVVVPTVGVRPIAQESTLELSFFQNAAVPDWWRIGAGGCRPATVIEVGYSGAAYSCDDYFSLFSGGASGSAEYLFGPLEPGDARGGTLPGNQARLIVRSAVDTSGADAVPGLTPGDEMFLFAVNIKKTRTVGTGACAGCVESVCMFLRHVRLTLLPPDQEYWETGLDDDPFSGQGALAAFCGVPTNRTTWRQVKSLYR